MLPEGRGPKARGQHWKLLAEGHHLMNSLGPRSFGETKKKKLFFYASRNCHRFFCKNYETQIKEGNFGLIVLIIVAITVFPEKLRRR